MFGGRCSGCGHSTNWTSPCTCDEEIDWFGAPTVSAPMKPKPTFEQLERYLSHDAGCTANDLDPLDQSPCTCGLRQFYDPWNRKGKSL
jgi:hypothetical protein